jgi:hypothetical protein
MVRIGFSLGRLLYDRHPGGKAAIGARRLAGEGV